MTGIIWYENKKCGERQLEQVIKNYSVAGIKIQSVVKSKVESYVIFDNNDVWRMLSVHGSYRGYCCNISYIQRNIQKEKIEQIILPMTKGLPYNGWQFYN